MMWNRAELKMRGNMAFKKNYVSAVVVALLMGIFGTVSGESSARRVSEIQIYIVEIYLMWE